jgi:hypothetical protein
MTLYELYIAGHNLRESPMGATIDLEIKRCKVELELFNKSDLESLLKDKEYIYLTGISFIFLGPESLKLLTEFMALYELINHIEDSVNPMIRSQLETCFAL